MAVLGNQCTLNGNTNSASREYFCFGWCIALVDPVLLFWDLPDHDNSDLRFLTPARRLYATVHKCESPRFEVYSQNFMLVILPPPVLARFQIPAHFFFLSFVFLFSFYFSLCFPFSLPVLLYLLFLSSSLSPSFPLPVLQW